MISNSVEPVSWRRVANVMNAAELKRENEQLQQQLQEAAAHQAALEEQFARTIAEKDAFTWTLRHQIKLLLLKVRGSRQERIDPGRVREVACWIHARRSWHQAIDNDEVRANTALSFIARLSQIEGQQREAYPRMGLQGQRDFEAVAAARQQHSLSILNQFKSWMDRELETGRVLPKSAIRQAFTYTINQWSALCRYTEAGYLSGHQRRIRRIATGPMAAVASQSGLDDGHDPPQRTARERKTPPPKTPTLEPRQPNAVQRTLTIVGLVEFGDISKRIDTPYKVISAG